MVLSSIKEKYFTPVSESGSRINNFNIIRFIAALMVLYGHMAALMEVPVPQFLGQNVSTIGVKIFFIISGYLITKSYMNDSNFLRYMIRRCFRIFPGLIALTILTVVVVGGVMTSLPLNEYFTNGSTVFYLRNMFLYPVYALPGVFQNNYPQGGAINGSLWSLPVEFTAYLILPVVVFIFKKLKCLKFGVFFSALVFTALDVIKLVWFPQATLVFYGTNWMDALALMPYFFIGSFWSFEDNKKYFNVQLATLTVLVLGMIKFDTVLGEICLALILPYFVFSFAFAEKPFFANWFSKCDFSYGIYLYSFVVQQILLHQISKFASLSLNLMSIICFIGALICGIFSWYLVEKPAQKLGNILLNKLKKQ